MQPTRSKCATETLGSIPDARQVCNRPLGIAEDARPLFRASRRLVADPQQLNREADQVVRDPGRVFGDPHRVAADSGQVVRAPKRVSAGTHRVVREASGIRLITLRRNRCQTTKTWSVCLSEENGTNPIHFSRHGHHPCIEVFRVIGGRILHKPCASPAPASFLFLKLRQCCYLVV